MSTYIPLKELVTREEAARLTGLSVATIDRQAARGVLKRRGTARAVRFWTRDLERLMGRPRK